MNHDRYNMNDTPESWDEREAQRREAEERAIDYGDWLRDQMLDRRLECEAGNIQDCKEP